MQKTNSVGFNIRKVRELKGFSQDYMAEKLKISQASYARIENEHTQITVNRLFELAEILNTDILDFFDVNRFCIQTQNNHKGSYGNGYIQNFVVENKEIIEKLINSYEERLKEKDEQISLLKSLIK